MDESVLEAGTTWVKLQKEEKCDIIEEVEIMSGNSEWVSQDLLRRNWGVDGNGKPLRGIDWSGKFYHLFCIEKITNGSVENELEWMIRLVAGWHVKRQTADPTATASIPLTTHRRSTLPRHSSCTLQGFSEGQKLLLPPCVKSDSLIWAYSNSTKWDPSDQLLKLSKLGIMSSLCLFWERSQFLAKHYQFLRLFLIWHGPFNDFNQHWGRWRVPVPSPW